jgi:hypothetical protein
LARKHRKSRSLSGAEQRQLLVDTILRDYDVPKPYWRKLTGKSDRYGVADGQQRLRAIWTFFAGEFRWRHEHRQERDTSAERTRMSAPAPATRWAPICALTTASLQRLCLGIQ